MRRRGSSGSTNVNVNSNAAISLTRRSSDSPPINSPSPNPIHGKVVSRRRSSSISSTATSVTAADSEHVAVANKHSSNGHAATILRDNINLQHSPTPSPPPLADKPVDNFSNSSSTATAAADIQLTHISSNAQVLPAMQPQQSAPFASSSMLAPTSSTGSLISTPRQLQRTVSRTAHTTGLTPDVNSMLLSSLQPTIDSSYQRRLKPGTATHSRRHTLNSGSGANTPKSTTKESPFLQRFGSPLRGRSPAKSRMQSGYTSPAPVAGVSSGMNSVRSATRRTLSFAFNADNSNAAASSSNEAAAPSADLNSMSQSRHHHSTYSMSIDDHSTNVPQRSARHSYSSSQGDALLDEADAVMLRETTVEAAEHSGMPPPAQPARLRLGTLDTSEASRLPAPASTASTPSAAANANTLLSPTHSTHSNRSAHSTGASSVENQPMRALTAYNLAAPQQTHIYSDRFIPSRMGSHLESARAESPPKPVLPAHDSNNLESSTLDANSQRDTLFTQTYTALLKNELLGGEFLTKRSSIGPSSQFASPTQSTNNSRHATPQHSRRNSINNDQNVLRTPSTAANNKLRTFRFQSPAKPTNQSSATAALNNDIFYSTPGLNLSKQSQALLSQRITPPRKIARTAYRVLDAPQLKDDYYLNLVDWSHQNVVAVALSNTVYLWNANTSRVTRLMQVDSMNYVTSVAWSRTGNHLAVGTKHGQVQLWDVTAQKHVRSYEGHGARVGTLAFNHSLLASGSRDRNIMLRDARAADDESRVSVLRAHRQEVCGLKWAPDDVQLASGGNDNKLYIWNVRATNPVLKFSEHRAAVKAIAWSPHQPGLLCSGGGTADKHIRFWNALTAHQQINNSALNAQTSPTSPNIVNDPTTDSNGTINASRSLYSVDTGSQVCQLAWSSTVNEIVSTHGYSLNQVIVWKYQTSAGSVCMSPLATLTGHSMRVLYLAMSPDGSSVVTGAGDECLRFWSIFPSKNQDEKHKIGSPLKLPRTNDIR